MWPEVFVTDVMGAAIFTEVITRMGKEAPPFLRMFWYGCGDRKHRFSDDMFCM